MKCPLCKTLYGYPDHELDEFQTEEGRKIYECKVLHSQFCEHMLKGTRKNIGNFSCGNCTSPIDDCDCFDCEFVFCDQCNDLIHVDSCSTVVEILEQNEDKQGETVNVGL